MRIAIITPGFLPVPDSKGGAVEILTGFFIECNEKEKKCKFDLYTLPSDDININFKETKLIPIYVSKFEEKISKILNFIYRKFLINKHSNFYINKVIKEMEKRKENYDYILIENNMYSYQKIYEIYKNKTKFIFHLHNDIGGQDKPIDICKFIAKTSFRTIVVSNYIKKRFESCTGGKADILLNCIDDKSYEKIDFEFLNKIVKKYSVDPKKKIYMYIGRVQKEKGCLELVKAFSNSEILSKKAQLFVVGSIWYGKRRKSTYYEEIQKYTRRCDNIFFTGGINHDKISTILSLADICVIPSICEEAFGMVALEAMKMKKAIIVSKSGGLPEVVEESTPILDRENIVENLRKVMEDYSMKSKQELIKLGEKQYKKYNSIQEFNSVGYLNRLINILENNNSEWK